jgi:CRP-like cAMP-binding protein
MALDDDMRVLAGVRLFEGFTHEQLRLMAFGAENISLNAGRNLYDEGATADCAFVIAEGRVALYRERDGRRTVIEVLGPGSIMGEFALIANGRRLTGAAAETPAQLIRLNRSMFRRILEEYPETALDLHARISAELTDMIARIERVAARLAD